MSFVSRKRLASLVAGIARRVQAVNDDRAPGMVIVVPRGEDVQACIDRQVAQRRNLPEVIIWLPDNQRGDRSL